MSRNEPSHSAPPSVPPNTGIYVNSILIERPIGDPYLDKQLWVGESAQIAPHTKVLLSENGLRAIVLAGNLPPQFQNLLNSKTDTINPQSLTFANRTEAVLATANPPDPCEYQVLSGLGAERTRVKLIDARAGMLVRPELTADGRVKVRCEPRVQHGEREQRLQPTSDTSGFTVHGEVPVERYPDLGFEVVLSVGDYLVIGWPTAAEKSIGSTLFSVEANGSPRQRILVIRAGYWGDVPSDLPTIPNVRGPAIASEVSRW